MRSRFYIGLAGMALAVALLSPPARAASVLDSGGLVWAPVTINGDSTVSSNKFTATVDSARYLSTDSGWATYRGALGLSLSSTDTIFAYIVHVSATTPTTLKLNRFSVYTGYELADPTTGIATLLNSPTSGDAAFPASTPYFSGGNVIFNLNVGQGQQTGIMLFSVANTSLTVLQSATLSDTASGQGLVLSIAGPQGAGTDLPLPLAASGGIGLFGLGALRRRVRV